MRSQTLIVLALVTLPVLALDVFLPDHNVAPAPAAGTTKVLPSLGDWIGQVTKLSVVARAGTVNLERKIPADPKAALGTGWTLPDKGGYPVQATVVEPLLQGLLALREVAPRTDRPKLYDRLDLMDSTAPGANSRTITLAKADGAEVATLVVGKHYYDRMGGAGGGDGLYVRKPDVTQTWLARPVFDVPADMLSWVDRRIVDIEANKIKTLTLGGPGIKPILLTRANKDALIALDDVPKGGNVKAQGDLDDIAAGFRYLDMLDVRPASQITAPPTASVEVTTFDGLDLSVTMVEQDGGTWAVLEAKGDGDAAKDAADITARVKGWAYKLPEARAKSLTKRLGDLVVMTPPPAAPATPAPKKG
jgi:hypothetical protein